MDQRPRMKSHYSRRQFLKGLPLGMGGALVLGVVLSKLLPTVFTRHRRPPVFPKGSIFTPARDFQRKT